MVSKKSIEIIGGMVRAFFITRGGLSHILLTDVTSSITTLIVEGISAHSMLLDSYVVLHAAFVSALHKLIGVEFGTLNRPDIRALSIHMSQ